MAKKEYFIVYNESFEIERCFEYWGKAIMNYLDENPSFAWINTGQTLPYHREILARIKQANIQKTDLRAISSNSDNFLRIPQNSNNEGILKIRVILIQSLLDEMGTTSYEVQYYMLGQSKHAPCIEVCVY